MRLRICVAVVSILAVFPSDAQAIQLLWSNGTGDVECSTAARCTLFIQAADLEGRLPKDFRLRWVTDTMSIIPVPIEGPDSCGLGLAQLATLGGPFGNLETTSNQLTASFCSLGSGLVYSARYIVDIPQGAVGTLGVAAIDPADPNGEHVVQSGEVRFNGGCTGALPPVILRVFVTHESLDYEIRLIGAGLQAVTQVWLVAPDDTWEVPLTLASATDTELRAAASLAAWVPDCKVLVRTATDMTATESVPADPPPPPLSPQAGCQDRFIEDVYPPAVIQPKDFAFVPGGWSASGSWTFHLFYIRQNQLSKQFVCPGGSCIEKNLGHAVSNDLHTWTVLDTAAIRVRPGRWDSQHVWAPTIVRKGVKYYMFYTGVDNANDQRIGIATSTDLIHWTQGDSVLDAASAGLWVEPAPSQANFDAQLRDPYVIEDPSAPGKWLMYFTAWTKEYPGMATGFVRGTDVTFNQIDLKGVLWRSQQNRSSSLESPHVFQRAGKWWLLFTKPTSPQDTIYAFSSTTSPTDTVTGNWSAVQDIRSLVPLNEATAYTFWHGTEHLRIAGPGGGKEYLAGFNDSDQSISYTQMQDIAAPLLFAGGCPDALDVDNGATAPAALGIKILGSVVGRDRMVLEITLPERQIANVAIHDLLGRRVRTLASERLAAGPTRVEWNGLDAEARRCASGVYFATVTTPGGRRSARLFLVR